MEMPGEWEDDQYSPVLLKFFCMVPLMTQKKVHDKPPEPTGRALYWAKVQEDHRNAMENDDDVQLQLQGLWLLYVLLRVKGERTCGTLQFYFFSLCWLPAGIDENTGGAFYRVKTQQPLLLRLHPDSPSSHKGDLVP